jgi:hypothetical protein
MFHGFQDSWVSKTHHLFHLKKQTKWSWVCMTCCCCALSCPDWRQKKERKEVESFCIFFVTCMSVCICVSVWLHIHTFTHTHIHTYTHRYSVYVASKELIFVPLSFEARHVVSFSFVSLKTLSQPNEYTHSWWKSTTFSTR